jgi:feruloyl-CoA synthase
VTPGSAAYFRIPVLTKKIRKIDLWSPKLAMEERADGSIFVWREDELGPYPASVTDPLIHWAETDPDRVWMAQRDNEKGGWRTVTFGEALAKVRSIGQAMLDFGLNAERPVVILSPNSIEHALLALGAQHVAIPSAAIAPAYSLLSADHTKLKEVEAQLTAGLVFADDGERYRAAIEAVFPPDIAVVTSEVPLSGRSVDFASLMAKQPSVAVDRAHERTTRDTVAKFMFTSGTTGTPKAVIQTHGTIASNQAMAADCYAFMKKVPPVVVDWAPWNHTASGTKVFYLVLFNGGTFYLDEGKPAPGAIAQTIRNLREIAPTWYFNVPAGFDLLVKEMETDDRLRENFFNRLQYLMYAGAPMALHTWEKLAELSERTIGMRVLRSSSLGSTETGPFALCGTRDEDRPDNVGIPARGVVLKLVPTGDKLEARIKSPSITPGYWRNEVLTAKAFDEEGFYRLGDAIRFAEPGNPAAGFFFDGRLAENFKLGTGTFVTVGPLRGALMNALGGLARDAVLAGEGREEVGALLLPFWPAVRAQANMEDTCAEADILASGAVRSALEERLAQHAKSATGSANRVTRIMFLDSAPSIDKGEVTDKGSLNQRIMLRNNTELVAALYDDDDPRVIRARP